MDNMNYEENLGIVKISDEVVSVIAGIACRRSKWSRRSTTHSW